MGLWSIKHAVTVIPAFLIMPAVALILRRLLLHSTFEVRMLPIKIISVLLIALELGKQICSLIIGYNLYHLPLHFCSIFIYVLPFMAFYRGKRQGYIRSIATSTMTVLFFGMLIMPAVIYSEVSIDAFFTNYLDFHTVLFHNLVIFALFITLALNLHKPEGSFTELLCIAIFGLAFAAASAFAAHALNTNFSNFLGSTVPFINVALEFVSKKIGNVLTAVIYNVVLICLHAAVLVGASYVFIFAAKTFNKLNTVKKSWR